MKRFFRRWLEMRRRLKETRRAFKGHGRVYNIGGSIAIEVDNA